MNKLEKKKKQLIDKYIVGLHLATKAFIEAINADMDDSECVEIIKIGSAVFSKDIEEVAYKFSYLTVNKLKID